MENNPYLLQAANEYIKSDPLIILEFLNRKVYQKIENFSIGSCVTEDLLKELKNNCEESNLSNHYEGHKKYLNNYLLKEKLEHNTSYKNTKDSKKIKI